MEPLIRGQLHASVIDPAATSMNFLNEVAERFPNAVSLAAGRPYDGFFDVKDITRYIDVFIAHLRAQGRDERQIALMLMQYGRTNGILGELIAATLATDEGITVAPETIAVTAGCQEAMVIVLRALCASPEDVLLAASPCYVGITGAARIVGVEVVPVPEGPDGLDPATVERVAAEVRAGGRRPRAFYVVPDFANPSGDCMPVARRLELLRVAERAELLIMEDDPYGLFGADDRPRPKLKALPGGERVIYLGSFAKSGLPGARVGFVVADQVVSDAAGTHSLLADELSTVKSMLTVNTAPVAQAVIGGLLVDCGCSLRARNTATIEHYRGNLATLLATLDEQFPDPAAAGVGWRVPAGGFFAVINVPFVADPAALEVSAREFSVLWTPMLFFYPDGGGEHSLRVSYSALEADEVADGVRRLAAFIRAMSAPR